MLFYKTAVFTHKWNEKSLGWEVKVGNGEFKGNRIGRTVAMITHLNIRLTLTPWVE